MRKATHFVVLGHICKNAHYIEWTQKKKQGAGTLITLNVQCPSFILLISHETSVLE
jgi:hypothetical protein